MPDLWEMTFEKSVYKKSGFHCTQQKKTSKQN